MKINPVFKKILLFTLSVFLGFIIVVVLFPLPSRSKTSSNLISPIQTINSFSKDQPPSESLKGSLTTLSGEVAWQSRIASKSSSITKPQNIQQGETLETGDKGSAQVSFDKIGSIVLDSKTEVNFAQTLPINLVLALSSGSAKIIRVGSVPISIRAFHLLTQIDSGEATIIKDIDNHLVTVTINSGSSTLAWTDLDNSTKGIKLTASKKFIFDDDQRKRIF